MMRAIEKILYFALLVMMIMPAAQKELQVFRETPLEGDFSPAQKPEFTMQGWLNGDYQARLDQYLNDNIGFNPYLIRLNNQIDWSFYRYIHADGVVRGKGGHLFEYDYIRSYTGVDYIGEGIIDKKMRRLKFLQDYMKDSLDIDLIFVLEPGKASFYPEFIPDRDLKDQRPVTNYSAILKKAGEYSISLVDLNDWFTQLKGEARWPMYGQYGTHWSLYGMSLAADTLLKLIEDTRTISLREVTIDTFLVEDRARKPDYDMATAMNLMFRLHDREPLAYPVYSFGPGSEDTDHPMVLVVGDSYYWNIFNTGIPKEVFSNEAFWYFGKLVYPDYYSQPTYVEDLDIKAEVEKQDVILLMTTERFLYKFDWKLVDELFSIYGATSRYDKTYDYACQITRSDEWFSMLIDKAKDKGISLEKMLFLDARYIYKEQEPISYAVYHGVEDLEAQILNDAGWLEMVTAKARENNKPLDEQIREDAEYTLSTTVPDSYALYRQIRDAMEMILRDSILVDETHKEARYFRMNFDEMLFIKAEKMMQATSGSGSP